MIRSFMGKRDALIMPMGTIPVDPTTKMMTKTIKKKFPALSSFWQRAF